MACEVGAAFDLYRRGLPPDRRKKSKSSGQLFIQEKPLSARAATWW